MSSTKDIGQRTADTYDFAAAMTERRKAHLVRVFDGLMDRKREQGGLYVEDVLRIAQDAFHAGARAHLETTLERDHAAELARRAFDEALEARLAAHRLRMAGFPTVAVLPWPEVGGRKSEVGGQVAEESRGSVLLTSDVCPLTSAKGGAR